MSAPVSARLKADLVLLAATVGWGLTFPIVKLALDDASPGAYLLVRFLIGAAAAFLLARRSLRHLPSLKAGALLGVLLWLSFTLNTWGLKYTSATRSGFITSLCVVLVPLVGALFFRQSASLPSYVGAAIAACGLYVLSAPSLGAANGSLLGDGLTVLSALAYAFQILFTDRAAQRIQPLPTVASELVVVSILCALSLPFEPLHFRVTPTLVAVLLYTGVFASAVFFAMQIWAQARTTAVRAALIFSLEPIFAAFFARALLADPLGPETWQGGGLILLGILFAELAPRLLARRAPTDAPGAPSAPESAPSP